MGPYQQYSEILLPPWCLTPNKLPLFDTAGILTDNLNSASIDSVQDSFIQDAPSDVLPHLGNNFNIPRPPGMSDATYRNKLEHQWDYWLTSGTPARLITEIQSYGYPNVSIIPEWIESPPGTWTKSLPITDPNRFMDVPLDPGGVGWWSNFWIIINQPHPFTQRLWGTPASGTWGTGGPDGSYLWGGVAGDQNALKALVDIIQKLKPAWTSCRGIVFGLTGFITWGSFNWNDGTHWGVPMGTYAVYYIRENWEIIGGY